MKRFALLGIGFAMAAICITGCGFDTGSDADSWSSAYDWVNFSGVYRAADDSILTTTTSTSGSTTGSTGEGTTSSSETTTIVTGNGSTTNGSSIVASEPGTANGDGISRLAASGTLSPGNIVPLSVRINLFTATGILHSSYTDDGEGNLRGGTAPGVVVYLHGGWSIDFSSSFGAPEGGTWSATYRYYPSSTPGGGSSPSTTNSVSVVTTTTEGTVSTATGGGDSTTSTRTTETAVYYYTVQHKGQYITLTDNNGFTYEGTIDSMASAAGAQNTDIGQVASDETGNDSSLHAKNTYYESPLPSDGDQVIATFQVSGAAGTVVGSLSGHVDKGVIQDRWLDGTAISGGAATAIKAVAPAVQVAVTATPTPTPTTTSTQSTGTGTSTDTGTSTGTGG